MKRWISEDEGLPFIGRTAQLEQLSEAMQRAHDGSMQTVFVQGEAGIGKTRLVDVAASDAARNGWLVIRGRSQTVGEGLAFAPLMEAFRLALSGLDELQKKQMGEAYPYLNVFYPDLGGPLPVPLPHAALERTRLFETLRMFTVRLTAERPLFFWLDDLPQADPETLEWLQYCMQHTADCRILFVATCRTSHDPSSEAFLQLEPFFLRHELAQTIQLEPLEVSESTELMRNRLGGRVQEEDLLSLHARTLGIPLYISEMIHALVRSGGLQLHNGSWELLNGTEEQVPLRITSLFEHRMDKLTQTEQELLNLLAVSDATVPWRILRASWDAEPAAQTKAILALLSRSLIREENDGLEQGYGFRHPLIKAVAHARVSQTLQRQAHRKLAAAWKEIDVIRAAFHILASGNTDDEAESARLLYEAGKRHLSLHSYRTAADYLQQAARLAESGAAAETGDLPWRIRLILSETLTYLDRPQQALQLLNELYLKATEAGMKIRLKRLMAWVESTRSYEWCVHHIEDGLEAWDGLSENGDVIWMLNERIFNDLNSGRLEDARKSLLAMQDYGAKFPSVRTSLLCLIREAHVALMSWTHPSAMLAQADGMLEEARMLGEPELIYDVYCLIGYAALNHGDFATAIRYSAECAELVRRHGMVVHEVSVRIVGMCALFQRGDWALSLQEAEAMERLAREYEIHGAVVCILDLKALILVLQGNREEGLALLRESERRVREVFPEGGPQAEGRSLHVVEAVIQLMQETGSLSIAEPVTVYWANTHGMQLFLKMIEGLWLIKAGLNEPAAGLLDRLQTVASGQQASYVEGIMHLLSGLLPTHRRQNSRMANERLAHAVSVFETLRTPLEQVAARFAWASAAESQQADAAMRKSAEAFRRLGALACAEWVEGSLSSPNSAIIPDRTESRQLLDLLTNREEEVLRSLASGLSNKEIALSFGLTEGTVKIHVFNLYSKLGVKRRTQAIARAREWGLLDR